MLYDFIIQNCTPPSQKSCGYPSCYSKILVNLPAYCMLVLQHSWPCDQMVSWPRAPPSVSSCLDLDCHVTSYNLLGHRASRYITTRKCTSRQHRYNITIFILVYIFHICIFHVESHLSFSFEHLWPVHFADHFDFLTENQQIYTFILRVVVERNIAHFCFQFTHLLLNFTVEYEIQRLLWYLAILYSVCISPFSPNWLALT